MDGTEGGRSGNTWANDPAEAIGLDIMMEKHEAYLRRRALREEEQRRRKDAAQARATVASEQEEALRDDVAISNDPVPDVVDRPSTPIDAPPTDKAQPDFVRESVSAPEDQDRNATRKARRRQRLALAAAAESAHDGPEPQPQIEDVQIVPEPKVLTLQAQDRIAEDVAVNPVEAPLDTPVLPEQDVETPIVFAPTVWDQMRSVALDANHLSRNKVITANRHDPAHVAFDVLRTRLLAALRENGWKRVAITSPTKNCGKTFVAANLAISLARQADCKTVLMDLDLRNPSLAKVLGVSDSGKMADFLTGDVSAVEHFRVPGTNALNLHQNIAFGLNDRTEGYAAELLLGPDTGTVLAQMEQDFDPDVVLYDLPPALYHDDVIAFRPHFDGVLLVVGGGVTKPKEIREVKRRLGENTPLLGVVMNKAEGLSIADYSY